MLACIADEITDRPEAPTQQAIELARQRQLQLVKDLRRRLAMDNWCAPVGSIRPLGLAQK